MGSVAWCVGVGYAGAARAPEVVLRAGWEGHGLRAAALGLGRGGDG